MSERNWARQYRLSKKLWHYQIVRLDHDDAEALRALAARQHTSVAESLGAGGARCDGARGRAMTAKRVSVTNTYGGPRGHDLPIRC